MGTLGRLVSSEKILFEARCHGTWVRSRGAGTGGLVLKLFSLL